MEDNGYILDENNPDYGKNGLEMMPTSISKIAYVMARTAAIKGGQKLSITEMEYIIDELFKLPNPQYTPNGNPVIKVIDNNYIQSLFQ